MVAARARGGAGGKPTIGAIPATYGADLSDQVRAMAPGSGDAVLDDAAATPLAPQPTWPGTGTAPGP